MARIVSDRVSVSVALPSVLVERIDALAAAGRRNRSQQVTVLLELALFLRESGGAE